MQSLDNLLRLALGNDQVAGRLDRLLFSQVPGAQWRFIDLLVHINRSAAVSSISDYLLARAQLLEWLSHRPAPAGENLLQIERAVLASCHGVESFAAQLLAEFVATPPADPVHPPPLAAAEVSSPGIALVDPRYFSGPPPEDAADEAGGGDIEQNPPSPAALLALNASLAKPATPQQVLQEEVLAEGAVITLAEMRARLNSYQSPITFWLWLMFESLQYDQARMARALTNTLKWARIDSPELAGAALRREQQLAAVVLFQLTEQFFYALHRLVSIRGPNALQESRDVVMRFIQRLQAPAQQFANHVRPGDASIHAYTMWSRLVVKTVRTGVAGRSTRVVEVTMLDDGTTTMNDVVQRFATLLAADMAEIAATMGLSAQQRHTTPLPLAWTVGENLPTDIADRQVRMIIYAADRMPPLQQPLESFDWLAWIFAVFRRQAWFYLGNVIADEQVRARRTLLHIEMIKHVTDMLPSARPNIDPAIQDVELFIQQCTNAAASPNGWLDHPAVQAEIALLGRFVLPEYWRTALREMPYAALKLTISPLNTVFVQYAPLITIAACIGFANFDSEALVVDRLLAWMPDTLRAAHEHLGRLKQEDRRRAQQSLEAQQRWRPTIGDYFQPGPFRHAAVSNEHSVLFFVRGQQPYREGVVAAAATAQPELPPSPSPSAPSSPASSSSSSSAPPASEAEKRPVPGAAPQLALASVEEEPQLPSVNLFGSGGGEIGGAFGSLLVDASLGDPNAFADLIAALDNDTRARFSGGPDPPLLFSDSRAAAAAAMPSSFPQVAVKKGVAPRLPTASETTQKYIGVAAPHLVTGWAVRLTPEPKRQSRNEEDVYFGRSGAEVTNTADGTPLVELIIDGEWSYRASVQTHELAYYAGPTGVLHTNAHLRVVSVFGVQRLFDYDNVSAGLAGYGHYYPLHASLMQGAWNSSWLYHDGQRAITPHPLAAMIRPRFALKSIIGGKYSEQMTRLTSQLMLDMRPQPSLFTEAIRHLRITAPGLHVKDDVTVRAGADPSVLYDRQAYHVQLNSGSDSTVLLPAPHEIFNAFLVRSESARAAQAVGRKETSGYGQAAILWGRPRWAPSAGSSRRHLSVVGVRELQPHQSLALDGTSRGIQPAIAIMSAFHIEPLDLAERLPTGARSLQHARFALFIAGDAIVLNAQLRPSAIDESKAQRLDFDKDEVQTPELRELLGADRRDIGAVQVSVVAAPIIARMRQTNLVADQRRKGTALPPASISQLPPPIHEAIGREATLAAAVAGNPPRLDALLLPTVRRHTTAAPHQKRMNALVTGLERSKGGADGGRYMFRQFYPTELDYRLGVCVNSHDTMKDLRRSQAVPLGIGVYDSYKRDQAIASVQPDNVPTWGSGWIDPYEYWPMLELPDEVARECLFLGDFDDEASDRLPVMLELRSSVDTEVVYYHRYHLGYGLMVYVSQQFSATWTWLLFLRYNQIPLDVALQQQQPQSVVPVAGDLGALGGGAGAEEPAPPQHQQFQRTFKRLRELYDISVLYAQLAPSSSNGEGALTAIAEPPSVPPVSGILTLDDQASAQALAAEVRSLSDADRQRLSVQQLGDIQWLVTNLGSASAHAPWLNRLFHALSSSQADSFTRLRDVLFALVSRSTVQQLFEYSVVTRRVQLDRFVASIDQAAAAAAPPQQNAAVALYGIEPSVDVLRVAEARIAQMFIAMSTAELRDLSNWTVVQRTLQYLIAIQASPWTLHEVLALTQQDGVTAATELQYHVMTVNSLNDVASALIALYKDSLTAGVAALRHSFSPSALQRIEQLIQPTVPDTLRTLVSYLRAQVELVLHGAQALWYVLQGTRIDQRTGGLEAGYSEARFHTDWPTLDPAELDVIRAFMARRLDATRFAPQTSVHVRTLHFITTELYCSAHVSNEAQTVDNTTMPLLLRRTASRTPNSLLYRPDDANATRIHVVPSLSDVLGSVDALQQALDRFLSLTHRYFLMSE